MKNSQFSVLNSSFQGRALLICNGEAPPRALARRLARRVDLIVAADGGANVARALGITPHIVIGDLDSVLPATRRHFASSLFLRIPRQDNTDFEKALDYLAERDIREVVVIAATGRRFDYTLANAALLWLYARRFVFTLVGDGWRALPAARVNTIASPPGTTVSLVPFGAVSGITLAGLQYPLRNGTLRIGQVAVSNIVVRSPFSVHVGKGNLLIIVQDTVLPFAGSGKAGRHRRNPHASGPRP